MSEQEEQREDYEEVAMEDNAEVNINDYMDAENKRAANVPAQDDKEGSPIEQFMWGHASPAHRHTWHISFHGAMRHN